MISPKVSIFISTVLLFILETHDQHLQTVFNICKTYIRIIVQRQYAGVRIHFFQFFDNSSSHHMVWQTAERLKDHKSPAAMFGMVDDLSRDQDSFSGIKSMVDNRIAVLHQILHTAGWCVERALSGDLVCHIMGCIKSRIGSPQPDFL